MPRTRQVTACPTPELHPDSTLSMWPDNRIARDAHYLYRYDRHGSSTEKTDLIPEGVIRARMMSAPTGTITTVSTGWCTTRGHNMQSRWSKAALLRPAGPRVAKRVWRRERDLTGWMSLSRKPQVTWYGWDGDRLTTIQRQNPHPDDLSAGELHATHQG